MKVSPRSFCLRLGGYLMSAERRGPLSNELARIKAMLAEVDDPLDRKAGCECSDHPGDNPSCRVHCVSSTCTCITCEGQWCRRCPTCHDRCIK